MENLNTCPSCTPKTAMIAILTLMIGFGAGYYFSTGMTSKDLLLEEEVALESVNPYALDEEQDITAESGEINEEDEYVNPFSSQGSSVINPFRQ
ncbi:MAG: hypothetical protein COV07_03410 [Candidatus Vogelbacteria bacterium CG10_big_fil_rev_8_21_14_0_10_45_14]|uniref:Uncharacterized protein n=1 Tax=Candidatus Vogelbacteria bacterium CG10_big_fil_rev_8_21_14_0_10_45_14 TaxID=1975042 RepID=A0A2H0RJK8_9BACT|nr:MAG: hypothetical protein COV07_03410 [Candidatus Vogelbacteria bacterium CG10_big_fil_rev_8_21_14_0_10_45_14]